MLAIMRQACKIDVFVSLCCSECNPKRRTHSHYYVRIPSRKHVIQRYVFTLDAGEALDDVRRVEAAEQAHGVAVLGNDRSGEVCVIASVRVVNERAVAGIAPRVPYDLRFAPRTPGLRGVAHDDAARAATVVQGDPGSERLDV